MNLRFESEIQNLNSKCNILFYIHVNDLYDKCNSLDLNMCLCTDKINTEIHIESNNRISMPTHLYTLMCNRVNAETVLDVLTNIGKHNRISNTTLATERKWVFAKDIELSDDDLSYLRLALPVGSYILYLVDLDDTNIADVIDE